MTSSEKLFKAVAENDPATVRQLLDEGVSPQFPGSDGATPLHQCQGMEVARVLVAAGADVNARDRFERTPLHTVKDADVARVLVEAGADPTARSSLGQSTALHHQCSAEKASVLVEAGADVNARDSSGNTPLHGMMNTDAEKKRVLIEAGADVNAINRDGRSPLGLAQTPQIATLLREHGAVRSKTEEAQQMELNQGLTNAAGRGDVERVVEILAYGANPHQEWKVEGTPLQAASTPDVAKVLIEAGADVNAKSRGFERTALHTATNAGVAKVLVDHGADVCARDASGNTPLHTAKNVEVGQALVEAGADPLAVNNKSNTPLQQRTQEGASQELVDVLRAAESRARMQQTVNKPGPPSLDDGIRASTAAAMEAKALEEQRDKAQSRRF